MDRRLALLTIGLYFPPSASAGVDFSHQYISLSSIVSTKLKISSWSLIAYFPNGWSSWLSPLSPGGWGICACPHLDSGGGKLRYDQRSFVDTAALLRATAYSHTSSDTPPKLAGFPHPACPEHLPMFPGKGWRDLAVSRGAGTRGCHNHPISSALLLWGLFVFSIVFFSSRSLLRNDLHSMHARAIRSS